MHENQVYNLRGIVPPLATPLHDQDTLDQAGLRKLIKHVIDGGVQGLFMLGTTGEAPSLSYTLRKEVVEVSVAEVSRSVPVLVGISDSSLSEAIDFARFAAQAGASAVVVAPPFYYPATQQALYNYVIQLCAAVDIPLYIYNIPSHSPHAFSPETIVRLLEHPQVAGYKDSTCSMMAYHQLKYKLGADFEKTYLLGPEELLAESVMLGAHGGVNGGANIFPKLYVRLYEAAVRGDTALMNELHQKVMQVSQNLYQGGKTVIQGVKFALAEKGICQAQVALPLVSLSAEEKENMRSFLHSFDAEL